MVSALGQHSVESMQAGTRCLQELPGGTTMGVKGEEKAGRNLCVVYC